MRCTVVSAKDWEEEYRAAFQGQHPQGDVQFLLLVYPTQQRVCLNIVDNVRSFARARCCAARNECPTKLLHHVVPRPSASDDAGDVSKRPAEEEFDPRDFVKPVSVCVLYAELRFRLIPHVYLKN